MQYEKLTAEFTHLHRSYKLIAFHNLNIIDTLIVTDYYGWPLDASQGDVRKSAINLLKGYNFDFKPEVLRLAI